MMLKSVSLSPLVPGKPFTAIKTCHGFLLRNGGQLNVSSTSLTCPQHLPSFYLLAAKRTPSGLRSGGLSQNGVANQSSQALWPWRSDSIKSHSATSVKAIHGKPYPSARLQEGSSSSASSSSSTSSSSTSSSSSSSPAFGGAQRQLQALRPWLLFGLCMCASAASATGPFAPPVLIGSPPAAAEALARRTTHPAAAASSSRSESEASHGKKVYFDYHVTGVPGDGRCLFRAVAHGACLRSGRPAPDESTQRQMADDLRNKALDELVRRRESSEWFIEGDFDAYVRRMRLPHTWGGEPELLMLSNVLRMPITVYMKDKGGIIAIAEYGQEHGTDKPIRVLYHGFGHYEALHLPEDTQLPSRLSYCSGSSSKTYPTRRKR